MAAPSDIDRPVETGHELILATLLLHLDADEIHELPPAWQPVVQDVYDIAANLAKAKAVYQWELVQLRAELDGVRSELISERFARLTLAAEAPEMLIGANAAASVAMTARASLPSEDSLAPASKRSEHQRVTDHAPASAARPMALKSSSTLAQKSAEPSRWNSSTRVHVDDKATTQTLGAAPAQPALVKAGLHAYQYWASAPARQTGTNVPTIAPLPPAPASQSARQKKAIRRQVGKSASIRSSTRVATSVELTVKALPTPSATRPSLDRATFKCLVKQIACERRVHLLQRMLGQVSQWKIQRQGGDVTVLVTHMHGGDAISTSVHNAHDIRAALSSLCDEAEAISTGSFAGLARAEKSSDDNLWLLARQKKVEEMLAEVEGWIDVLAKVVNRFSGEAFSKQTREEVEVSKCMWKQIHEASTFKHACLTRCEVELLREQLAMPKHWRPLTPLFIEYAITSLAMDALDVFVTYRILGSVHASLNEIGEVARELQALFDQFQTTKKKYDDCPRTVQWDGAVNARHINTLASIQRRAIVCSETICGTAARLGHSPKSGNSCFLTTTDSVLPASRSRSVHNEIIMPITSAHVTFTRFSEASPCVQAAARSALVNRLSGVLELMAPSADPRFADETDSSFIEHYDYIKLTHWCDAVREIITSHGIDDDNKDDNNEDDDSR